MRRRPSGSNTEEDDENSSPEVTVAIGDGDRGQDGLRDSARTSTREAVAKDRRRNNNNNNESAARLSTSTSTPWPRSHSAAPRTEKDLPAMNLLAKDISPDAMVEGHSRRRLRLRNPWACSLLTLGTTLLASLILLVIVQSFLTRQLDPKGCNMSYMRPSFVRFSDFDTEHTRFATKYSLYLYREQGIDEDTRASCSPEAKETLLTLRR